MESSQTLTNDRALQAQWDSIINARSALQAIAVAAAGVVLMN
ncbi:hypothetical protein [Mycolicibacterium brisbanense]